MNTIRFDELTYTQISSIIKTPKKSGVILPVGCTEQHGVNLPVGCDTAIARGASENLALNLNISEKGYDAYVLPDFAYTPSPGAEVIPGTISTSFEWLGKGLKEIVASVVKTGWQFCILLNGHAQNVGRAIETSMAAAQGELGYCFPVIIINAYDFANVFNKYGLTPSSHAGEAEASLYSYYSKKQMSNQADFPMNHYMRNKPGNIFGLSILERSHDGIISDGLVDMNKVIILCNQIGKEIDDLILKKVIENLDIYFKEWSKSGKNNL